jgi:hypothetical protein
MLYLKYRNLKSFPGSNPGREKKEEKNRKRLEGSPKEKVKEEELKGEGKLERG